jgi:mRNA-degrading endonuclease toxin of MazEF toxin-antitoxin module
VIPAAQFSVHRSRSRIAARPFVVILQSDHFKRMPSRVVAPLVVPSAVPGFDGEHPRVAPILVVQGRVCIVNPFDIATVGVNRLGDLVASFAGDEEAKRRIRDALDAILKPF